MNVDQPTVGRSVEESRLVSLLPVAMLRTDTTGRCVEINPAACQLLALPPDRAFGLGWLGSLEEGPRTALQNRLERSSSESHPFTVELLLGQPDGGETALSCHVVPLANDGGMTGHWVVLLDETERQETERTLRHTAQELEERVRELNCLYEVSRAVERSAGDLSAILQETVCILPRSLRFAQAAWARITLEGKSFKSPGYGETPWLMEAPVLVHGEEAGVVQVGYRKGAHPPGQDSFSPEERTLLDAVAQRLGRTAERVTGRRLLQEREEETRQRLTHLTRVSTMGEMASSIAHEVNQPLTAIATYAQACRRMVENGEAGFPEVQHVLTRISEEALRAGGIIHRLKDMVRRQESRWTECDVNALIRDVEQLALMDARLQNVSLIFQLAPDLPPVLADGIQLQQVVLNLIRNGIDAVDGIGNGLGEVVVRTEIDEGRRIRVAVRDNGCGLSPGAIENLFQPFYTTKKEGMGMGLSISRSIISAHRGRIAFASDEDQGTTFFFTLPILSNE